MTHRYTIMLGGTILPGGDDPAASALAWAGDTLLAIGSDVSVGEISRGDSHVVQLNGSFVVPLAEGSNVLWPSAATLEVGGPATFAVFDEDPRTTRGPGGSGDPKVLPTAVIRSGRLVTGALPGGDPASAHVREGRH